MGVLEFTIIVVIIVAAPMVFWFFYSIIALRLGWERGKTNQSGLIAHPPGANVHLGHRASSV